MMAPVEIPRAPIEPPRPPRSKRLRQTWNIPTLAERLYDYRSFGGYSGAWLFADWKDAKHDGDLLYVGRAREFCMRLHPRSHVMWSIYQLRPEHAVLRIALWSMSLVDESDSVERWLVDTCAPLWNSTDIPNRSFTWRDPDLVLPAEAFHPYRRESDRPPFSALTGGVYAWIVGSGDAKSVMVDGAEERRLRRTEIHSRPELPFWRCHAHRWPEVNDGTPTAKSRCWECGRLYVETTKAARERVAKSFGEED